MSGADKNVWTLEITDQINLVCFEIAQISENHGADPKAFIVSTNIARKERSKWQKAMALAIIYPEPEKGGRGKRSEKLLDFSRSLGIGIEHA